MDKKAQAIKDLVSLKPGNGSFVVVPIAGKKYDAIQAYRLDDLRYHVEILKTGGDPDLFDGNRIFEMPPMEQADAIRLFMAIVRKGDSMELPKGAKEVTKKVAGETHWIK